MKKTDLNQKKKSFRMELVRDNYNKTSFEVSKKHNAQLGWENYNLGSGNEENLSLHACLMHSAKACQSLRNYSSSTQQYNMVPNLITCDNFCEYNQRFKVNTDEFLKAWNELQMSTILSNKSAHDDSGSNLEWIQNGRQLYHNDDDWIGTFIDPFCPVSEMVFSNPLYRCIEPSG